MENTTHTNLNHVPATFNRHTWFVNCRCAPEFLHDGKLLTGYLVSAVRDSKLEVVGSKYYDFPDGGTTAVVVLAESHLAVHTWPESNNSVQVDISVCHYSRDNTGRALDLQDNLKTIFKPEHIIIEGDNGKEKITEYRLPGFGYFVEMNNLLAEKVSDFQRIQLFDSPGMGKVLVLDGLFQTSEKDEYYYHEPMAHMPLLNHSCPRDILIIGGGDGGLAEEVLKHPSVEKCTIVEIDKDVVDFSKEHLHTIHNGVFSDSRLEVITEDGYTYVEECSQSYDVILLDLTDPVGCCKPLFSTQFYQNVNKCLNPDGFAALHMGFPLTKPEASQEIYYNLSKAFNALHPYTHYVPLYGTIMAFCMASNTQPEITTKIFKERIKERSLKDLKLMNAEYLKSLLALPNNLQNIFK